VQLGSASFHADTLTLVKMVTLLLVPFYLGFGVLIPALITAFLPDKWHGATFYIVLLLPGAGAMLITAWFDRVYEVLGRQKTAFAMELVFSIIIISVYWYMLASSQPAAVAVCVYSILIALYNILWAIISWKIALFPIDKFVIEVAKILLYVGVVVFLWVGVARVGELGKIGSVFVMTIIIVRVFVLLVRNAKQLKLA